MNQRLISDYVVFGLWVTLEQQVNLDYNDEFYII